MHCSKLTGLIGKSILLLILVEWLFQAGVKIVKKILLSDYNLCYFAYLHELDLKYFFCIHHTR